MTARHTSNQRKSPAPADGRDGRPQSQTTAKRCCPRRRGRYPAKDEKAQPPQGGQPRQHPATQRCQGAVQGVQRHQQQRDQQRFQVAHVLAGGIGAQVLPHGDAPGHDAHTQPQGQQQKQRQLGAAGVGAGAGAAQRGQRHQHREDPEGQHGEEQVADHRKGQKGPLLGGEPAGLVVGVAQPRKEGELAATKQTRKAPSRAATPASSPRQLRGSWAVTQRRSSTQAMR